MAAALFLSGFASTHQNLAARSNWIGLVSAALFGVMAVAIILGAHEDLPPLVDPSVRTLTGERPTDSGLAAGPAGNPGTGSEEFSLTHDVDAHVWTEPSQLRLDSRVQGDALCILREAFANAARHGQAKRIEAVIAPSGTALSIMVRDNGPGFDPAYAERRLGLRSIAEREERRHVRPALTSSETSSRASPAEPTTARSPPPWSSPSQR